MYCTTNRDCVPSNRHMVSTSYQQRQDTEGVKMGASVERMSLLQKIWNFFLGSATFWCIFIRCGRHRKICLNMSTIVTYQRNSVL